MAYKCSLTADFWRGNGGGEGSGRPLCLKEAERSRERETEVSPDPTIDRCSAITPGFRDTESCSSQVAADLPESDKEGHSLKPSNHFQRPDSGFRAGPASPGMLPGP